MCRFIMLFLFLTISVYAGEPDKEFHEKCLYPTVMVIQTEQAMGTGFIFKSEKVKAGYKNLVISCTHVTGMSNSKSLFSIFGKPKTSLLKIRKGNYENWSKIKSVTDYDAQLVFSDKNLDLSILSFTSDQKMPTVTLDLNPEIYIGDEVFRIGCGAGEFFKTDYGKITAVNSLPINKEVKEDIIRTDIPTIMGDSGGPSFYKTKNGYKCFGVGQAVKSRDGLERIPLSEGFLTIPNKIIIYHISYIIPLKRIEKQLESFK